MSHNVTKGIAFIVGRNVARDDLEAIRYRLLKCSETSFMTELAQDGPDRLSEIAERIRDTEILIRETESLCPDNKKRTHAH